MQDHTTHWFQQAQQGCQMRARCLSLKPTPLLSHASKEIFSHNVTSLFCHTPAKRFFYTTPHRSFVTRQHRVFSHDATLLFCNTPAQTFLSHGANWAPTRSHRTASASFSAGAQKRFVCAHEPQAIHTSYTPPLTPAAAAPPFHKLPTHQQPTHTHTHSHYWHQHQHHTTATTIITPPPLPPPPPPPLPSPPPPPPAPSRQKPPPASPPLPSTLNTTPSAHLRPPCMWMCASAPSGSTMLVGTHVRRCIAARTATAGVSAHSRPRCSSATATSPLMQSPSRQPPYSSSSFRPLNSDTTGSSVASPPPAATAPGLAGPGDGGGGVPQLDVLACSAVPTHVAVGRVDSGTVATTSGVLGVSSSGARRQPWRRRATAVAQLTVPPVEVVAPITAPLIVDVAAPRYGGGERRGPKQRRRYTPVRGRQARLDAGKADKAGKAAASASPTGGRVAIVQARRTSRQGSSVRYGRGPRGAASRYSGLRLASASEEVKPD
eukprot:363891-Chlamydomonas_euryale.AAC.2